jgi:molybdopterin converting factor small subunit
VTPLQIPRVLQQYCEGRPEVELPGETVREVLAELHRRHPALYICICNETGAIRRHVNLFVNDDLLGDREGLDTHLVAGDMVSVFQSVSGG